MQVGSFESPRSALQIYLTALNFASLHFFCNARQGDPSARTFSTPRSKTGTPPPHHGLNSSVGDPGCPPHRGTTRASSEEEPGPSLQGVRWHSRLPAHRLVNLIAGSVSSIPLPNKPSQQPATQPATRVSSRGLKHTYYPPEQRYAEGSARHPYPTTQCSGQL